MTFRRARLFAAGMAALALLGACGGDGSDTAGDDIDPGATEAAEPVQPESLTMTATKDTIEFPAAIEAEPVSITLDNQTGKKGAFIGVGKLNEGVTVDQIAATMQEKGGSDKVLGLVVVAAELDASVKEPITVLFPEGQYVALNPDDPKVAPVGFEVTAASGDPVAEPEVVATIETGDFYFKADDGIPAEGGLVAITNVGVQSHMAVLATKGKTPADSKEVAFSIAPAPGGKIWMEWPEIKPGEYSLMCFFPDPKSGKPHFKLGMALDVTI